MRVYISNFNVLALELAMEYLGDTRKMFFSDLLRLEESETDS